MYIESICYKRPKFNACGYNGEEFSINLTNLNPHLNVIVGKNDTAKEVLSDAMWRLKRIFDDEIDYPNYYYEIIFVENDVKYLYILSIENFCVVLEKLTCLNDNSVIFERILDKVISLQKDIDTQDTFVGKVFYEDIEGFGIVTTIFHFITDIAYQEFWCWGQQSYFDSEIGDMRDTAYADFPKGFEVPEQFKCDCSLKSRLGFINFLLYVYSLKRKENQLPLVWLDSVGCGLDFDEQRRIGHLIYDQYAVNNQSTQFFMTTHERAILNAIPTDYWQILEKSEQGIQVYNVNNTTEAFSEFQMMGLSNFDMLSGQMYKETYEN